MNDFEKLVELLEQNQFELLEAEEGSKDRKLVYLMNDAVESFLVFKNAKCTGSFDGESEEAFDYTLYQEEDRYVLKIDQEEHCFLMFFEHLELSMELYDYSGIGHFWVKGYEYLRVLEYQIAILRDKLDYLGEAVCTKEELKLAHLKEFPPLNYTNYPSASLQYIYPMEDPWRLSPQAAELMHEIANEVGDLEFAKHLMRYEKNPSKQMARSMAKRLRKKKHQGIVHYLKKQIELAASVYPRRSFGLEEDQKIQKWMDQALAQQNRWAEKGIYSEIYREEPFVHDTDPFEWKVRLMVDEGFGWERKVKIETIK